jgi:hypothetical protein
MDLNKPDGLCCTFILKRVIACKPGHISIEAIVLDILHAKEVFQQGHISTLQGSTTAFGSLPMEKSRSTWMVGFPAVLAPLMMEQ